MSTPQGFPPRSLLAICPVTFRGSRGRSQHSKECLPLAVGPQDFSHGVTKFSIPPPPFRAWPSSVHHYFHHSWQKRGRTVPGAHPKTAWEEGELEPLTCPIPYTPLAPPQESQSWGRVSRDKLLHSFFREIPQRFLREKRQVSGL